MADQKPYQPSEAEDLFPEPEKGDFLAPMAMPSPGLMMGESMAIIVFTTVEDQRIGVPMSHQALSDLHQTVGEALRMLQAPEGGSVQ
ncbi:hypothetical protein [Methylobacterium goesingense]|uniref:Uncharacterized protein n=1 Tax=Methylobacterium goesingense TaxID=243690 RepID=A0ABV2L3F5_9HYPH|nr:hypothetical protein [Methylobacterium goesingense]GJD73110.1 hypothetical protein CFIICLFH_1335 [Methylobacterium goesingense]